MFRYTFLRLRTTPLGFPVVPLVYRMSERFVRRPFHQGHGGVSIEFFQHPIPLILRLGDITHRQHREGAAQVFPDRRQARVKALRADHELTAGVLQEIGQGLIRVEDVEGRHHGAGALGRQEGDSPPRVVLHEDGHRVPLPDAFMLQKKGDGGDFPSDPAVGEDFPSLVVDALQGHLVRDGVQVTFQLAKEVEIHELAEGVS